jgi:hypothetical protein
MLDVTTRMGRTATLLGAVLLITLTACSTTSVSPPSPSPLETVGFSGLLGGVGDECGLGVSYEVVDGVGQTRGYCSVQWMDVSDPRFTGRYTRFVNVDEYGGGDVAPDEISLSASTVTHRVENEGGAWLGDMTVSITIDDVRDGGESVISPQMVAFSGSGGYEGLTAIVWWQPQDTDSQVRGIIIPGPLPAVPPPAEQFPFLPAEE